MKKIRKIIIFVVMLLMVVSINNFCYATSCEEIESSAADFKRIGENQVNDFNQKSTSGKTITDEITGKIAPFVNMLIAAGILIIGICMVILGIQWVMARPSPEEQAKMKNKFLALAISAAVLFGSFTIWEIIIKILDKIDG